MTEDIDATFTVGTPDGKRELNAYSEDGFRALSNLWARSAWQQAIWKTTRWLGFPVQQLPNDLFVLQEIICSVRPRVIIETGVAEGGSIAFYSSLLEFVPKSRVIGIDIAIGADLTEALKPHPIGKRIHLIEGSSTDARIYTRVNELVGRRTPVLVALDSDHRKSHVQQELEMYGQLVTPGSYMVVFDGNMPQVADAPNGDRAWREDNPRAAVEDFLPRHPEFEVDRVRERLGATFCPRGFLRRRLGT